MEMIMLTTSLAVNTVNPSIFPSKTSSPLPSLSPSPLPANDSTKSQATLPLCWAYALRLVWPLAVVQTLPTVRFDQRRIAREASHTIGRHWGIREALKQFPRPVPLPTQVEWQEDELNIEV
jgi:hypothetical protein